jgi:glutamate transport system permease protein
MSGASVLFDAPGPRARRRNAILTVIGALLVVAILGVVVLRLADNGQLDGVRWEWLQYERIQRNIFIDGLTATLKAFVISAVLSVVVGLILSIGRLSTNRWLRYPAVLFVTVFRALPVVVLMFIPYFAGSSVFGESIPLLWCVVFGLVVYNSSVLAEIFRAGVLAVPKGQSEAAASIGLSRSQTLRIVLFPQAIRTMLPTIISQLVVVLKDTALGFVIGYEELLVKGQEVARDPSFRLPYIPVAIVIGAVYIVLCSLLSWLAVYVERRTGSRRRPRRAFDTGVGEPVPGDAVLELPV